MPTGQPLAAVARAVEPGVVSRGHAFGTQFVGAIHGRLLTSWATAGIIGPVVVNYIREAQIGAGVPRGAPKPDIGTVDALKRALDDARATGVGA